RRSGRRSSWMERLRLRPINKGDWRWTVGGLVTIAAMSGGVAVPLGMITGRTYFHPSFMAFAPLGPVRYWILGAWLPFFVLTIAGEELVWRGVVLPRQEGAFGER